MADARTASPRPKASKSPPGTTKPRSASSRAGSPCLFLSHSGADTEAARDLKRRILASPAAKAAGLSVWFDKDSLKGGGDTWQKQLEHALESEMTAFAVYVGSRGIVNWVEREVRAGLTRATGPGAIPFIPILAKEASGTGALPFFARQHQIIADPLGNPDAMAAVVAAALSLSTRPRLIDNPFVGLRAMSEKESDRFFGRTHETDELVERMKRFRLTAIVAESGSGKSSLAQAGMIPRFRGGGLEDTSRSEPEGRIRHVLVMRAQSDPTQGLRDAVTRAAEALGLTGDQRASLRRRIDLGDVDGTAYALQCDLPVDKVDTLLVVDQFEELITHVQGTDRDRFIQLLLALARRTGPCGFHVLITVRSDYFAPFLSDDGLKQAFSGENADAVYRLRRITDAGIEEAVKRPLEMAGHEDAAEQDALVKLVQRDTMDRAGDLALIQAALRATWLRREAADGNLVNAYTALGGVPGALAHEAEKARIALKDEAKLLMPVFVRLIHLGVTGGATRRTARLAEFDGDKRAVIDKLATDEYGRLLLATDETVEIAHEALVTQWAWLNNEINVGSTPRDIRRLELLMSKAEAWRTAREDTEQFGAAGAELESLLQLRRDRPDWLTRDEQRFLESCAQLVARRTRRTRLLYGVVAAAIAGTALITGVFLYLSQMNQLELAAVSARNEGLRLGALVSQAERDLNAGDTLSALGAVRDVLNSDPGPDNEFYRSRAFAIAYAGLQKRLPEETFHGALIGERDDDVLYLDRAREKTSVYSVSGGNSQIRSEFGREVEKCNVYFCYDKEFIYDLKSGEKIDLPDGYFVFSIMDEDDLVLSRSADDADRLGSLELFHARLPDLKPVLIDSFAGDFEWGEVSVFAAERSSAVLITGESSRSGDLPRATLFRGDFVAPVHLNEFSSTYFPNLAVFNPDASLLATSAGDPSQGYPAASIWDVRTGKVLASTPPAETKTSSLAFAEESKRLLLGNENGELIVFDAGNGKMIAMLARLSGKVIDIDVDVDAHRICAVWSNGTVGVWDSLSLLELQRATFSTSVSPERALCARGQMYASLKWGDALIQRWNISDEWKGAVLTTYAVPARRDGMVITGFSIDGETGAPAIVYGSEVFDCSELWIPGKGRQDCDRPTVNDVPETGVGWRFTAAGPTEPDAASEEGYFVRDGRFCIAAVASDGTAGDPVCPIALKGEVPKYVQLDWSGYHALVTADEDDRYNLTLIRPGDLQVAMVWRNVPIRELDGIYAIVADSGLNNLFTLRGDDTVEVWNLASKSLTVKAQSRFIYHGEGWRTFAVDLKRGILATYGDGFAHVYRFDYGADDLVRIIGDIIDESVYAVQ